MAENDQNIAKSNEPGPLAKLISAILILFVFYKIATCEKKSDTPEYKNCVIEGIQYFKDIGSFPRLSDGRDAERVAEERCLRTTGAFGPHLQEKPKK